MKTPFRLIVIIACLLFPALAVAQNATEIVRKAEQKMRGKSSKSQMEMKIVRPAWSRTIRFITWTKGNDYSLTLVTAPAKEAGQTFMKRKNELWNWVPSINRMVKLPPSMMSQGWMGSDFSNDDIIKEFSMVEDYHHSITGAETIDGHNCYVIELQPKENAAVVWGKVKKWISKDRYLQLKTQYFDEEGALQKTETASDVQKMDDRYIPVHFEIIPADKEGHKTIMEIETIDFNIDFSPRFFTQQNMKHVRKKD